MVLAPNVGKSGPPSDGLRETRRMSTAPLVADTEWVAPGPGTWERDQSHFSCSITPVMTEIMEESATRGIREGFDLVGAPLATMEVRFVRGQMYRRLVPIIGGSGRGSSKPPPAMILRLAFALHPVLRRRARVAEDAMASKTWLAEADRWDGKWKPDLVARNRELGAVDTTLLDDASLAGHVEACDRHLRESTVLHFRLHISDLGPIARLLSRSGEWDLDPIEVMSAMAGASPSTSAPRDGLRPLARELASLGVVPASLDEIRAASPTAADLLDAYLAEFGSRLTGGYDLVDLTLAEIPQVTLAALRDDALLTDATTAEEAERRGSEAGQRLREQVPPDGHAEFDELLDEARRLYGLRDENGPLTVEWPAGVLRIGMLEAGRRLSDHGRLPSADHVFDLSSAEIGALLRGLPGPQLDAIERRRTRRLTQVDADSPEYLGAAPVEPKVDGLPGAMKEMMAMTLQVVEHLEATQGQASMAGTGIGTESYVGTARVVHDAEEAFDRCEPGDVIITRFTAPTFNSVLAMAGAVVTEQGGLLCHTAVIARELGIAAVVGVDAALAIPDGAQVRVDPTAGIITLL